MINKFALTGTTFLFIFILAIGIIPSSNVIAATSREEMCTGGDLQSSVPILPKWYKYLDREWVGTTETCDIKASIPEDVPAMALAVTEILLRVAGILAVIFVIYGGFQYLISTGEPDKAKAARTTIINSLVGLMIAVLSTVIVNLVGRNIG